MRDRRLHALSADHHHALALARRALLAAAGERTVHGEPLEPHKLLSEVLRRLQVELEPHFALEERLLLPALAALGERALVQRTLAQHAAIRAAVAQPGKRVEERLQWFGHLLAAHVHFEERELFEVAQEKLDDEVLDGIAAACSPPEGDAA